MFCISMMIAQADGGTIVRHDRTLQAGACTDPEKPLRVDQFRKQLNKLLRAGFLEILRNDSILGRAPAGPERVGLL